MSRRNSVTDAGVDPGDDPVLVMDAVSAYPAKLIANATYGKTYTATAPYISTDRADLLRLLDRIEYVKKEVETIPASGSKITGAQFQKLHSEIWSLLTLARRIKDRIDG